MFFAQVAIANENLLKYYLTVTALLLLHFLFLTACFSYIYIYIYIYIFVFSGRFDVNHQRYKCKECSKVLSTSDPVVVTQCGFWPGSIKDMSYVFDQDLFLHWDIMQKQMPGVSERSFLKSLELFSK